MFGGSDEGYVQFNITPAFGTQLKRGDTVSISGSYVYKLGKSYALGVSFGRQYQAAYAEFPHIVEMARVVKSVAKGVTSTFNFSITVDDNLLSIIPVQEFNSYIQFSIYNQQDLSSTANTITESNTQYFRILKYVNPPALSNLTIRDGTNAYEHFGMLVQSKSVLIAEFDYTLDASKVPDISVNGVTATLGTESLTVTSLTASAGHASVTFAPIRNVAINAVLSISLTDSMAGTGTIAYANPINVLAYAPPTVSTIGDVDLARRYDYQTGDYGDPQLVLLPEGKYVMLNFATAVTSIASRNAWTLKVEYADANTPEAVWTTATTRSYPDGETMSFIDDITLVGETHIFDAGLKYMLRVTVTDFFETAVLVGTIDKAVAYFNITKHGVAIGMRSTADFITQKTESAYPIYPYAGIRLIDGAASKQSLAIADNASFTYYNADADIVLTSYGNLVSLSGIVKPTKSISGSNTLYPICEIPEEYAPTGNALNILQQGTDRGIWLLTISPKDDPNTPCQVSFSRYRSGSSSAQATTSTWLPFYAFWIAAPKEFVVQTSTAIVGMALAGEVYCGEVE